jgi:hypothetical protein
MGGLTPGLVESDRSIVKKRDLTPTGIHAERAFLIPPPPGSGSSMVKAMDGLAWCSIATIKPWF